MKNIFNIWIRKINKFSEIFTDYLTQLIIGDIVICNIHNIITIPAFSLENIPLQHPSTYIDFFAASHDQKPQEFYNMSHVKQEEVLTKIKSDYQEILINYFTSDKTIPPQIDNFIKTLFYANIPVPQIIEIHMEIIDEFSKQLKLEGRSNETLLDYRLTLIDILANLCELYRCSIAKPHS